MADTHNMKLTDDTDKAFGQALPADIDVLSHCGDLTNYGGVKHHEDALEMLLSMPGELNLAIAGNHEVDLDKIFFEATGGDVTTHQQCLALWKGDRARKGGLRFLNEGTYRLTLNSGTSFSVYASPYTPRSGDMASQYPTANDRLNPHNSTSAYSENMSTSESLIPSFPGVDIFVTQGPPKYIMDSCGPWTSAGCEHFRRAVSRATPILQCFGNVHKAWGCIRVAWKA